MQGILLGTEDKAGNKVGSSFVLVDSTFKQLIKYYLFVTVIKCSYGTGCYEHIMGNSLYESVFTQGGFFK